MRSGRGQWRRRNPAESSRPEERHRCALSPRATHHIRVLDHAGELAKVVAEGACVRGGRRGARSRHCALPSLDFATGNPIDAEVHAARGGAGRQHDAARARARRENAHAQLGSALASRRRKQRRRRPRKRRRRSGRRPPEERQAKRHTGEHVACASRLSIGATRNIERLRSGPEASRSLRREALHALGAPSSLSTTHSASRSSSYQSTPSAPCTSATVS